MQILSRGFQTSAVSRDIDTAAKFIGASGQPHRNPSLKQQLFSYAILGFALSEAMGLFCLMVAFLILFAM
ncbi:ATP synthase F(0) complex subunit C3, mitochondrial-like [Polyodon spathula]|uniref:ATP synthase F(0) complex subunit C3, mitochondrial-like n=1 Tax=Polyodon spathula TaxID=7913 RepID=UPI001B7F2537|nr:ATP synthase F(0) complex subunit C3, mitochondrial-like [Polyodon spathula]